MVDDPDAMRHAISFIHVMRGEKDGCFFRFVDFLDMRPELVAALRERYPDAVFFGAGGTKMAAAGVNLAFDLTQHSVVGLTDVLFKLLKFRQLFNQLLTLAIERKPDVVIGVDYGGFNLRFGPTATTFEIPSFKFHLNLVGELNVRNALAVIGAAKHCGLSNKQIQSAFDTFKGIKRRMEVKGIAGGVTVIDDFGHHPTAIRETLRALLIKYAKEKIWAIFEPRTNTTRRNYFQAELAESFADADAVVVAQVARLELLAPTERLNPEKLMQDIGATGKPTAYLPDADAIVKHLGQHAQGGDVVVVFSNGGFGDIHTKLLGRLNSR